jgi:hypothetical protein
LPDEDNAYVSWEDIIAAGAFVLVIGALLVGFIYGWSKHMGRAEPGQPHRGARTAPGSRAASLLTSLIGRIVAPVVVIGMVAAVVMAGWPAIVSILTALAAAVAAGVTLLVAWLWWVRRRRMRCSPDGAAALGRLVATLSPRLRAGDHEVLSVEGVWAFDYPKVLVLFGSDRALEQATTSGLLSQLAAEVAEAVRADVAFGRNRETFDSSQAVWATASRQAWEFVARTRR